MVANAEGTKSKKAMLKKRLSKTPTTGKKPSSKRVLNMKSAVNKPAPGSNASKSSVSGSSRLSVLSRSSKNLGSYPSLAVQNKPKESKKAPKKRPMVVNLNLSLNFVMPDGLSSPGGAGNELTLNLNDILEQQQAASFAAASSSNRRSTGQTVVKGKLMKKIGVQKPKFSKKIC